jgi:hypothetical protein
LAGDYLIKAKEGLKSLDKMNYEMIKERLHFMYGVDFKDGLIRNDELFYIEDMQLKSKWANESDIAIMVTNPSA